MKYSFLQRSALFGAGLLLSGCQLIAQNELEAPVTAEQIPLREGVERYAMTLPTEQPQPIERNDLSPLQQADLWDRIRLQLTLDIPEHSLIEAHRNWYLNNPNYIERVSQRAGPLLYFIVEEIEKRGLPLELVLVPIVESAYDTFAYSHGRASGLWQFIPSTAIHYGLDINWWYDGRRDIVAATETALDYFDRLHKTFDGDWLLAIAAYNGGQGRVAAAVRKNKSQGKPTDFWSLSLPRETRNYVPKILALASLLHERHEQTLSWRYVPNQPVLDVIDVGQQMDLALAANMSGLELDELHRYNAGYNRWATTPEGPFHLLLPRHAAEQFKEKLAETDPATWVSWNRHKVKRGESLITIARRYHTTPRALQQANNISGSLIRAGDYLLIPVASQALSDYSLSTDQRLAQSQSTPNQGQRIDHRVVSGDTLWDLSRTYNVGVSRIAQWNNMAPGDMLRPGQTLAIWVQNEGQTTSSGVTRTVQYQVRSGDSLARIASRFRVTIRDIERWNQINRERYLQPGQRLTLHVNVAQGG
ncbi:lytic transglycosylase [Aliidiomarina taiwanensis]|uniref:Lytic transglycosylase n=1 Tax=Aliidiomarina taiwanensis TaxID=946228 RepID=A0A432X218_9GAMM|nr:LysM peptidoglycan-binding domain-containing protein [Aliidiomarina taiwanensis]RUO40498.1 lytic transglycosylase [Aliidiomarina taiwanensis]